MVIIWSPENPGFSGVSYHQPSTLFIVLDEEWLISDNLFLFSCSFFSFSIRAAAKAIILSLINYDLTKPCHKVINLSIYQQISVENYSNFPSSFEYLFLEFLKSFLIVLLQFCPDKQVTFSFLVCKLTFLSCWWSLLVPALVHLPALPGMHGRRAGKGRQRGGQIRRHYPGHQSAMGGRRMRKSNHWQPISALIGIKHTTKEKT